MKATSFLRILEGRKMADDSKGEIWLEEGNRPTPNAEGSEIGDDGSEGSYDRNAYNWYYNQAWIYWWKQNIDAFMNWHHYFMMMHQQQMTYQLQKNQYNNYQKQNECKIHGSNNRDINCLKRSNDSKCNSGHKTKKNYHNHHHDDHLSSDSDISHHVFESREEKNDDSEDDFELNEEFKKFLEISEKHRQEREKEKLKQQKKNKSAKRNVEKDPEYFDVSEQLKFTTTEAPKPKNKREEYKTIYGTSFDKILNLEAEMQLEFDKFCDTMKPSYWPNIPLNL